MSCVNWNLDMEHINQSQMFSFNKEKLPQICQWGSGYIRRGRLVNNYPKREHLHPVQN